MLDPESIPVGFLKLDYTGEYLKAGPLNGQRELLELIAKKASDLPIEASLMVCLDRTGFPINVCPLSFVEEENCIFDAKKVLQIALLSNAYGVITIHNHPIQSKGVDALKPSTNDWVAMKRISEALRLFGLYYNDSIIVSTKWVENMPVPAFYSMRRDSKFIAMQTNMYKKDNKDALHEIKHGIRDKNIFTGMNFLEESETDPKSEPASHSGMTEEEHKTAIKEGLFVDIKKYRENHSAHDSLNYAIKKLQNFRDMFTDLELCQIAFEGAGMYLTFPDQLLDEEEASLFLQQTEEPDNQQFLMD